MNGVTTVIATRDRWSDLTSSLPHHEDPVILVDNGSVDDTPTLVREKFPHVRVIEAGRNLGAVARNLGVSAATTPYVAFADDDSWWAPGALDRASRHLEAHPRLGLIAARILIGPEERVDPVSTEMASSPLPTEDDLPGPPVLGFVACGSVVRRTAYLAAQGFDDVVEFAGEEERLASDLAALGWGLAYVDDVVAHHHPSSTRETSASRRARLARNRLLTAMMRRPWPVVAHTARALAVTGPAERRGVALAVPRAGRALARRAVVPPWLESRLRMLE
jgi:GT2 family glycosyltransferase